MRLAPIKQRDRFHRFSNQGSFETRGSLKPGVL
jgi:hypothetical protein